MIRPGRTGGAARVAAIVIVMVALAACTGPVDRSAQVAPRPVKPNPTSTIAPPDSTAPPDVTTTTAPAPGLEPPTVPDAFAIARRALEAPPGDSAFSSEDSDLIDVLEQRLGEMEVVMQALVWEVLTASDATSDDPGDDGSDAAVLAVSIYPYADFRGDPNVVPAMAELLAGEGGPPATTTVDEFDVWSVHRDDVWWYLWANHTHILLTAGPEEAARDRIGQLAAHNDDEYLWQAGDCIAIAAEDGLGLPYSPHGEDVVVPCNRPHQYEVLAGDPALFGAGPDAEAPPPDEVYADALGWCEQAFIDQVGGSDLDSTLEPAQFFPDTLEWQRGDRYAGCVVMLTDRGVPKLVDRSFAGRSDELAMARTVGDCHSWTVREPTVDCANPHDFEFLGEVAAPDEAWDITLDAARPPCEELLKLAARTLTVDGATLGIFPLATGPAAWAGGDRRVACFAVADQAGFPVRIAGSIGGDWEPAGAPEDGFTA